MPRTDGILHETVIHIKRSCSRTTISDPYECELDVRRCDGGPINVMLVFGDIDTPLRGCVCYGIDEPLIGIAKTPPIVWTHIRLAIR